MAELTTMVEKLAENGSLKLGTVGIAVSAEMCGRGAAVTGRPVFDVIRMRWGLASA